MGSRAPVVRRGAAGVAAALALLVLAAARPAPGPEIAAGRYPCVAFTTATPAQMAITIAPGGRYEESRGRTKGRYALENVSPMGGSIVWRGGGLAGDRSHYMPRGRAPRIMVEFDPKVLTDNYVCARE